MPVETVWNVAQRSNGYYTSIDCNALTPLLAFVVDLLYKFFYSCAENDNISIVWHIASRGPAVVTELLVFINTFSRLKNNCFWKKTRFAFKFQSFKNYRSKDTELTEQIRTWRNVRGRSVGELEREFSCCVSGAADNRGRQEAVMVTCGEHVISVFEPMMQCERSEHRRRRDGRLTTVSPAHAVLTTAADPRTHLTCMQYTNTHQLCTDQQVCRSERSLYQTTGLSSALKVSFDVTSLILAILFQFYTADCGPGSVAWRAVNFYNLPSPSNLWQNVAWRSDPTAVKGIMYFRLKQRIFIYCLFLSLRNTVFQLKWRQILLNTT